MNSLLGCCTLIAWVLCADSAPYQPMPYLEWQWAFWPPPPPKYRPDPLERQYRFDPSSVGRAVRHKLLLALWENELKRQPKKPQDVLLAGVLADLCKVAWKESIQVLPTIAGDFDRIIAGISCHRPHFPDCFVTRFECTCSQ